ncbi:hypothetical protein GQX74_001683 [Glossina fuscipes]|nr:hypothetical protein GQX74_001683 [Glossina fuscipes]
MTVKLYRKNIKPESIGIITPFIKQIKHLRKLFVQADVAMPKIGSVEGFQGEFIFFTTIIFNRTVRYNNVIYPSWAVALGWLSFALSLIFIPLHMLKKVFLSSGKANDNFYNALKADFWLPEEEEERSAYEDFKRYLEVSSQDIDLQRPGSSHRNG